MTVDSSARAPIALARSPNVVAPAIVALPPIIESLEPWAGILIRCRSCAGRSSPPDYLDSGAARRVPVASPVFATNGGTTQDLHRCGQSSGPSGGSPYRRRLNAPNRLGALDDYLAAATAGSVTGR